MPLFKSNPAAGDDIDAHVFGEQQGNPIVLTSSARRLQCLITDQRLVSHAEVNGRFRGGVW